MQTLFSRACALVRSPASPLRVLQRRAWAGRRNPAEIARLGREDSPEARSLARALGAVVAGNLSLEERTWTEKIESLRRELASSRRTLRLEDWGAVSPRPRSSEGREGPVIAVRTVGEICRGSASRPGRALLLFRLVRELKPGFCLELGTSLGISAAYLAAAQELNRRGGTLLTLEGALEAAGLARENLKRLGLNERTTVTVGRFQDTLAAALQERGPADFVFVDGHHAEEATLAYFETLLPQLSPGACLVFDDIAWSRGMARAWKRIASDPRAGIAVDLFTLGICLMIPTAPPRRYRVAAV